MTEFDFDELDRAVNNLMSDVDTSKRSEGFDDPEEKTLELVDTQDQQPVTPVTPVVTAPVQPLAAKRRGRFMDVVRPASSPNAAMPVKREPVVIQPEVEIAPAPVESNDVPDQTVAAETSETAAIDEYHAPEQQESVAGSTDQPSEEGDHSEDTQPIDGQESGEHDTDLPMESPFLADAKVEKRPLGSPTEDANNTYAAAPDDSEATPSEAAEEITVAEIAPEELAPDVMSIEADTVAQPEVEVAQETEQIPTAQPPVAQDTTTPTDIVPQYKEAIAQDSEPTGAMFDTAAYHQPLEHPAKKHSGWGIVVWVLVLLIVGAVAGAAYFYFTTQY